MFKLQEADSADYPAVIAITKRRLDRGRFQSVSFRGIWGKRPFAIVSTPYRHRAMR